MPQCIIGLVGYPGAGKGIVANLLKERYGATLFRFSSILSDILERLNIEVSRENQIKLSEALRKTFGEDVLAYAVERDAFAATTAVVVIDGIRRLEDLASLEPLPQFKLVHITAAEDVRYARLIGRGEKIGEREMTHEQFRAEEQAPTEQTIPSVAARAWKTIENSGTMDELRAQVDDMMKDLDCTPR